jgi:hypothetical protein
MIDGFLVAAVPFLHKKSARSLALFFMLEANPGVTRSSCKREAAIPANSGLVALRACG